MSELALPCIQVVSGLICDEAGRYLVALRPPHVPFPNQWEFPGGKIEAEETPYEALKRELYEEIGIRVIHAEPLLRFEHRYPNRIIDMHVWTIHQYEGQAFGAENQEINWVEPAELRDLNFPEGNLKLIHFLFNSLYKKD